MSSQSENVNKRSQAVTFVNKTGLNVQGILGRISRPMANVAVLAPLIKGGAISKAFKWRGLSYFYSYSKYRHCSRTGWTKDNDRLKSSHRKFESRSDRGDWRWQRILDRQTPKRVHPFEGGDKKQAIDYISRDIHFNSINHAHHPQLCSNLSKGDFTVHYNQLSKTPCWVYEFLTSEGLRRSKGSRKNSNFREDPEVEEHYGSSLDDYRGSGYDRGHMAAAGNHRSSQRAINETFLLSNILPQVGKGFNQDIWRHLEESIREVALQSRCLHLYTGPLYIPRKEYSGDQYVKYRVIGGNRVAVPTHLFKTLLIVTNGGAFNGNFLLSFIMPNAQIDEASPISEFVVSLTDIRILTGMSFFSFLKHRKFQYQEILEENNDDTGILDIITDKRLRASYTKHRHGQRNSPEISPRNLYKCGI